MTINEQIQTLRERGMCIDNEKKATENLSDIGYCRLGFYLFPFEKTYPRKEKRDHIFKEGANFDYAIKLYYFDFDLRNLFLRYISRIEIHFRTTIIYMLSNKYKNNLFWYINPEMLKNDFIESELYQKSIKNVNSEPVIKQDKKTHKRRYAPAWKAIEYMSFGIVVSIYDNLRDGALKHDFSVAYDILSPSNFLSYINTVHRLRNYCAHGKELFDIKVFWGNKRNSLYFCIGIKCIC